MKKYESASPSLKSISISNKNQGDTEDKKQGSVEISNNLPKENFSQEDLNKVWEEFSQSIKKDMPRLHQVFKVFKPTLQDDYNIELIVGSLLQKNDIEERAFSKMDGYIKKKLNNFSIQFNISVASGQQKNNAVYTSTDKYNYLAEQNENLHKLRQNFSLDFD